eukprot:361411-Pelagomonas_calceolata.AAC.1
MDGDKRVRVGQTNGVKQGQRHKVEGIREGAVTGDGVNGVSNMLDADDLSLTTDDPEVMHSKRRSCSSLPTFMYGDVALPEKEQFKNLGMLVQAHVDKHMTLKVSEEHAVRPCMAA